ncbi:choice-of-anchor J domain-containing protein [Vicingaceae bacterium]|nr:choice-of-anchor J domain-containing protein [Vicingaceae bacterium]
MKKLLLSAFGFAAMMASADAQIFSEDFDAGMPGTFTVTDVDGQPVHANVSAFTDAWVGTTVDGGLCAGSTSWYDPAGQSDDWMATPAITLPTTGNGIVLEFDAVAPDAAYADALEIYVSTTGATPADFTSAALYNSAPAGEAAAWAPKSISLSAFNGQTIYIGFRNNSTDKFVLGVDNIVVRETFADDAVMTSLNITEFGTGGNENIAGMITNNGGNDITSFDISYTVNGGTPVVENFTQTITAGNTYNFTCATPLAAVPGNTYNLEVSVTAANDADGSNDMLMATHTALTSIPNKVVVGEENTGTWCGWCPRGDVGLSGMNTNPNFIGIAVHNGDPMTIANYDSGASTYFPDFTGFPNGAVDRVIGGDPSTFSTMHSQRVSAIVPCAVNNITAVFNQATGMIEVSADADFVGNVTGEYRLSCVIVEDGIQTTGAGWSQTNYYDGGGNGTLTDPTSGFEWSTAGDPVVSTAFGGYKHVAVSLSNNDILGDAGSIAMNPTIGTTSHTFAGVSGTVVTDQTFANAHAVVMIVNAATAEIVNAGESSISVVTSTEKIDDAKFALSVFPNPTADNATVTFSLETANNVKMEVYNAMGALVSTKDAGKLVAGNHTMAFDGTDLNSGFYFVNLTIGNNVITKKVTLTK